MKPAEVKNEFIRLRAAGRSYSFIEKALHIGKGTCSAWEKELEAAISDLKREQLEELYSAYFMTKEARIKRLGETLNSLSDTLKGVDLSKIPPEKLLEYKLKYMEALKSEYTGGGRPYQINTEKADPKDIVKALNDLLERVRTGETTTDQATKESAVITSLLRAYDAVEIKEKLIALENLLESRG